jgi:hypothetical protein
MATAAFSTLLAAGDASMLQETRAGARALAGGRQWCALGVHWCAPLCTSVRLSGGGTQTARRRHPHGTERGSAVNVISALGSFWVKHTRVCSLMGLEQALTARPLVRLAPAAVSSPHTLTPSPTLCSPLLPTVDPISRLAAATVALRLLQVLQARYRDIHVSRSPGLQISRYPRIPRSASANRSLLTAVSAPTTLKIREPSASVQVPARDRPMSLLFPRFSPRRRRAATSATCLICQSHARLTGPSILHTHIVSVINTVICYTPSVCRFEACPCRPVATSARPARPIAMHV